MNDLTKPTNDDTKEHSVAGIIVAAAVGALALSFAYYHFRTGFPVVTLEAHAAIGNALAPVVAFLTLFALVAALWSVQVQRADLALQRKEIRETRVEMAEQRAQLQRSADAQEALASSQLKLAQAQVAANHEARMLRLAQMSHTIATLQSALAAVDSAELIAKSTNQNVDTTGPTRARRDFLNDRLKWEVGREKVLREKLWDDDTLDPLNSTSPLNAKYEPKPGSEKPPV